MVDRLTHAINADESTVRPEEQLACVLRLLAASAALVAPFLLVVALVAAASVEAPHAGAAISPASATHCRRHRGPWPLPPPGVHRCATVAPSEVVCAGHGTTLVCPRALYLLAAAARRGVRP